MTASDPLLQTATDAVGDWIDRASASGWISESAHQQLDDLALSTPSELFDSTERPLVVGLFGGTGVGKSTLLNRMAGQEIARVSVERPTSTSVTAFLHQSQNIDRLPTDFPMDRLVTSLHRQERWRKVLWLDMPDVDSVSAEHRELVIQWLPYIDLLIYVVSPERYRDVRSWTLLREQRQDHAWLFVFNQRDRGTAQQVEDFCSLLSTAGFAEPSVFATSSAPVAVAVAEDDQLEDLLAQLDSLSERKLIDELARRGVTERLTRLFDLTDELAAPWLARSTLYKTYHKAPVQHPRRKLTDLWRTHWAAEHTNLSSSLQLRGTQLTGHAPPESQLTPRALATSVFDAAAVARIETIIASFVQQLDDSTDLPRRVAAKALTGRRSLQSEQCQRDTEQAVTEALTKPGTKLQRLALRALTLASAGLPTAALLWIGWRVFDAFRTGATDAAAYLDVNFAVTAAMLVLIAWALPWWLERRLRPDTLQVLRHGLTRGIETSLARLNQDITQQLQTLDQQREDFVEELNVLQVNFADNAHRSDSASRSLNTQSHTHASTELRTPTSASESDPSLPAPLRRLISSRH